MSTSQTSEIVLHILGLLERGKRAEAERILLGMGVEALSVLRELLEKPLQVAKKSRWHLWLLPMLATPSVIFALFGPPEYIGIGSWEYSADMTPMSAANPWYEWLFVILFLTVLPGVFVAAGFNACRDAVLNHHRFLTRGQPHPQGQQLAAWVLTQMEDERAVGLLLETTHWLASRLPENTINASRDTLIRLLQRLTPETASQLTQDQRKALLDLLHTHSWFAQKLESEETISRGIPSSPYDVPMSKAILQAYTSLGDPKAIGLVESLSTTRARPHFTLEGERVYETSAQQVIDQAAAVLPKLRERCEALRTGESLLRAASKPEAPSGELLRPAQGSEETPPEQLLRAGLEQPASVSVQRDL